MLYTTLLFHFLESAICEYSCDHLVGPYTESGQGDNAQPKIR